MENKKLSYADTEHRVNAIKETRDRMQVVKKKYINDEEFEKIMTERMKPLTNEDIINMSLDELKQLNYVDENNKLINEPDMEDDVLQEYLRDIFLYMKSTQTFDDDISELLSEYDKIQDEMNEMIEKEVEEKGNGDLVTYLRNLISKMKKIAEEKHDKKGIDKYTSMTNGFEDSFTLNRIFNLYMNIGIGNTKEESEKKAGYIYDKYKTKMKELDLKNDLIYISDLEKKYLPEEYHDRNNLFVFICMKYISKLSLTKGMNRYDEGVFASQITSNLFLLYKDKLKDNDKKILLDNIMRILDLFK